jgi:CheY-like chemotaxis protein
MKALSILVVDDEESIRELLVRFFKPSGSYVTCAANGLEALRILDKQDFDLVITDVLMPEMDGIELIPQIRKKRPEAYILAMSGGGHNFMGDYCVKLAANLGAHAVIMKPFGILEMREAVERAFPAPGAGPG